MHKSYSCELCEEMFDSKRELKIHSYTHSFKSTGLKQRCDNCDFECEIIETMEVHIGKCKEKEFECDLCETKFVTLNNLEIHLNTCEFYECVKCLIREKNQSDMKMHIKNQHKQTT